MSPEHSGGLDGAELPARMVAAGETRFERLRRIVLYLGMLSAPSASDETGGTLGSVETAEGRRSARLTNLAVTGDGNGTVDDDGATQSRIAFNIREERRVLDRLQAALPPPVTLDYLDFPETGGSILSFRKPPIRGSVTNFVVYFGDPSHRSVGLKWARRAGGSEAVAKS